MEKTYLAVVEGVPQQTEWTCQLKLGPAPGQIGRMQVDEREGKDAETHFRVLQTNDGRSRRRAEAEAEQSAKANVRLVATAVTSLVEARPLTGRTHQIRLHLAETAGPVVGDDIYGRRAIRGHLGLRAVRLTFADPFTRRRIDIRAPVEEFCREYGFDIPVL